MLARKLATISEMPRAFLDSLGVGIVLIDAKDDHVVYANREFCRLLGYRSQELLEAEIVFPDLTHPDDRAQNLSEYRRLLSGEIEQCRFDKRYIAKDGAIVWAHVTAAIVRGEDGTPKWTTRVIEDVTFRKLLEQQLALAEEIGGIATWSWHVKPDESKTSKRYNALFGLADDTPQPSIEQFLARVHPDDRAAVATKVRRALHGGGYTQEYRTIRPDGEVRWMRAVATSVVNSDDEVIKLVGATIDITDAKRRVSPYDAPKQIKDVIAFLKANWSKPIAIEDVARQYGVSSRSIHKYFAAIGTTPMNFVKGLRLENAHRKLADPKAKASVTGVAFECGFTNLGHFARDYRKAFGELPSETLKRSG